MPLSFSLVLVVAISYFANKIAKHYNFSAVIGLIVAGLLLSSSPLEPVLISGHKEIFSILSGIGLFALMFLAGFEVSWNMLVKEKKDAVVVTLFSVVFSVLLAYFVFKALGFSAETGLIMGICFSITAEATKARVLIQLKKLKTRLGSLLMGTGIINDVLGVLFLVAISYAYNMQVSFEDLEILGGILIAFFLGTLVHYLFDRYTEGIKILEKALLVGVVPFFFIEIGLNFHVNNSDFSLPLLFAVVATAISGQIIGVMLTKPIIKLSFKQLFLVGWGMNSKGAVELAIAYVALQIGLVPHNLYSALVVTALVSTILFQVIIFAMVKKNKRIMN